MAEEAPPGLENEQPTPPGFETSNAAAVMPGYNPSAYAGVAAPGYDYYSAAAAAGYYGGYAYAPGEPSPACFSRVPEKSASESLETEPM